MEVIRLETTNKLKNIELTTPLSLAIGYFDGVHIGHQKVMEQARLKAKEQSYKSAVMTFDPSPKAVLGNNPNEVKYITLLEDKVKLIENLGFDYLFIVPFTKELSSLSPEEFIESYIIKLNVKHLVAGFDYTFGKFGKGTMDQMDQYSNGRFTHQTINKVAKNEEKISSTLIRALIGEGKVQDVKEYLGRYYMVNGFVIHGQKRGKKLGFPTANLKVDDRYILPKNGVYIVRLLVDGRWENGVASIGYNPTFNNEENLRFIEVHLLNFNKDIYGKPIVLEWRKYLRNELKFTQISDLIDQIGMDKQEAINYFENE
ncbi:riboflavin biosynthesis protein RibF [Bacillus andreraoultii]|uniref:riboflavin biosynthesis protein RibF n=1 Tax=Bacillus andreraoultii TaxID=1499685 RepID=UPI00053B435A|nr:riboflavin biosynthesis protein RibF [Bacillus andreraoultii]